MSIIQISELNNLSNNSENLANSYQKNKLCVF